MALMPTGVDNCFFIDPDTGDGDDQESVFIQDSDCTAKGNERENGKRKQEEDDFAKAPKRLRLDSICNSHTPIHDCDSTNLTRPNPSLPSVTTTTSPLTPSLALFRKSARPAAKKHTRPPTKKVFESLKLSPEEWVRLEGEAKAYMLDTAHPERQSCVGNRANGPTNDTKINLYKTVQRFLESDIGARFFDTRLVEEDFGERWVYPRDETALISLLTPLMRRMVTNERQRQYARKTRAAMQQQSQSRDQSPSQLNIDNVFPVQLVDSSAGRTSLHGKMEVFYLSNESKLFHRLAIEDVPPDYGKLHDVILAEYSHHRSAEPLQSLKIHVHGPYKLELIIDSNWDTVRDEIRSAAWTADGPIKVVVQCE